MKTGGRGMTAGRERFRFQRVLVASQVALSLVLLAGALLFARSLRNLMTRNPGFQQNGVVAADLDFTRLNLPAAQQEPFTENLLESIRAIPEVAAAATSGIARMLSSRFSVNGSCCAAGRFRRVKSRSAATT